MSKTAPNTKCPVCKTIFHRYPSQVRKGIRITCSRQCAARHFRDKGTVEKCIKCGDEFYRRRSQATQGYGTTCSRACHFALRDKKIDRVCVWCDANFRAPKYDVEVLGHGKFCSHDCHCMFMRRLRKRGAKNMFTNWQKREWKTSECAKCGATEKLELDHIIPRFAGGTTERSNAQTLCRTCNRQKFRTHDLPYYEKLLTQQSE